MENTVKIALLQLQCGENVRANEKHAIRHIEKAAAAGANIVCLQELFNARYFPQTVDVHHYGLAGHWPGPLGAELEALAKKLGIVLIVPVYEKAAEGIYFNTAYIIDADGKTLGKYRKTHIPDGPQYHEKYYFTPGDLGYPVWDTKFGRIAVGICWDEWYPEVARLFALQGPFVIFYPSAIGSEPDMPGFSSANAWETVIRSHAIANGVFTAAVNRVGKEAGMDFYGQSFVAGPFGDIVAKSPDDREDLLLATLELPQIRQQRELLQFFRDRRIDTYQGLLKRVGP